MPQAPFTPAVMPRMSTAGEYWRKDISASLNPLMIGSGRQLALDYERQAFWAADPAVSCAR